MNCTLMNCSKPVGNSGELYRGILSLLTVLVLIGCVCFYTRWTSKKMYCTGGKQSTTAKEAAATAAAVEGGNLLARCIGLSLGDKETDMGSIIAEQVVTMEEPSLNRAISAYDKSVVAAEKAENEFETAINLSRKEQEDLTTKRVKADEEYVKSLVAAEKAEEEEVALYALRLSNKENVMSMIAEQARYLDDCRTSQVHV